MMNAFGVMPKPPRSDGGRRLYDSASARRLGFIRCARELDRALTASAAQCEEDERGPCPIIEALETGRPQESSSS